MSAEDIAVVGPSSLALLFCGLIDLYKEDLLTYNYHYRAANFEFQNLICKVEIGQEMGMLGDWS